MDNVSKLKYAAAGILGATGGVSAHKLIQGNRDSQRSRKGWDTRRSNMVKSAFEDNRYSDDTRILMRSVGPNLNNPAAIPVGFAGRKLLSKVHAYLSPKPPVYTQPSMNRTPRNAF